MRLQSKVFRSPVSGTVLCFLGVIALSLASLGFGHSPPNLTFPITAE
jgi:hypothetical protein